MFYGPPGIILYYTISDHVILLQINEMVFLFTLVQTRITSSIRESFSPILCV